MWTVSWNEEKREIYDKNDVIQFINRLNSEYVDEEGIFVQIMNQNGDCICLGVGNSEGYSFLDYIPFDGINSKHAKGENEGDGIITFYMNDYESEFYISETIKIDTAIKETEYFLKYQKISDNIEWIDD